MSPHRNYLLEHYKKLFYVENLNLSKTNKETSDKVNSYFQSYLKPTKIPLFTITQLNDSLNDLSDSSVKGFDKLSYQLIKISASEIS